ncbi:hypothetical protein ASPTUDRAFT_476780 [Aspergillus tubingensis CBS 134.48]|uniref:Uncharacterized protein n=1 Tax=Aspergillus tubingensis (strain CBS 134.48) TaxID=767770 RepID=A0A1L9NB73_ASPTC|nr:hypothetical protein ASPTUDRAFT_476780 [Aspergillus tubingensis CBS 134.48]
MTARSGWNVRRKEMGVCLSSGTQINKGNPVEKGKRRRRPAHWRDHQCKKRTHPGCRSSRTKTRCENGTRRREGRQSGAMVITFIEIGRIYELKARWGHVQKPRQALGLDDSFEWVSGRRRCTHTRTAGWPAPVQRTWCVTSDCMIRCSSISSHP